MIDPGTILDQTDGKRREDERTLSASSLRRTLASHYSRLSSSISPVYRTSTRPRFRTWSIFAELSLVTLNKRSNSTLLLFSLHGVRRNPTHNCLSHLRTRRTDFRSPRSQSNALCSLVVSVVTSLPPIYRSRLLPSFLPILLTKFSLLDERIPKMSTESPSSPLLRVRIAATLTSRRQTTLPLSNKRIGKRRRASMAEHSVSFRFVFRLFSLFILLTSTSRSSHSRH